MKFSKENPLIVITKNIQNKTKSWHMIYTVSLGKYHKFIIKQLSDMERYIINHPNVRDNNGNYYSLKREKSL